MRERTTAIWEQLRLSPVSANAALHALLDEFGAILQADRFCLPSAFEIPPI